MIIRIWCAALAVFLLEEVRAQNIEPPPEGKAVVYFVRTSSFGFANSFVYFDSTKVIGKFAAPKYLRYECEPGHHLFWAKAENVAFVDATVDAGRVYFIYVDAEAGAEKPLVRLQPVAPRNKDVMFRIFKLMNKKAPVVPSSDDLTAAHKEFKSEIRKTMSQYTADKSANGEIAALTSDMFYPLQP